AYLTRRCIIWPARGPLQALFPALLPSIARPRAHARRDASSGTHCRVGGWSSSIASPAAPHRSGREVFPHPALRRCSCGRCRGWVSTDAPSEAVYPEPGDPGVGADRAPSPPRLLSLLTVKERQSFMDVAVDLGELLRGVAPLEVIAPASQHRIELCDDIPDGPFQPGARRRDRFDLGPDTRHRAARRPLLAVPLPVPPRLHQTNVKPQK